MPKLLRKYFVYFIWSQSRIRSERKGKRIVAGDLCNLCTNVLREEMNINGSAIQSDTGGGLLKI